MLANLLVEEITRSDAKKFERGSTAGQLIRNLAVYILQDEADQWGAPFEFAKTAKSVLDLDVKAVLDEAVPVVKTEPVAESPDKKARRAKRAKKGGKA